MKNELVTHIFPPAFDKDSRVLILGTIPSPKSREVGYYYSHPQNKFWRVMADLFNETVPQSVADKEDFLKRHRIALWDVLKSCMIKGADDGSIREAEPNDMDEILANADIRAIFTTGTKAAQLYKRYCLPKTGREAIALPSTSPANCRFYTYEEIKEAYRVILDYLPR
ncbi:MAG: DNA-deoxyinosine glycosylase [Selenomonadales bacterium]|nr:DNA-deoxyinosine glycosylase [Selenomonadales bacterium]